MELESGTTFDVKVYRGRRIINIEHHVGGGFTGITLTTAEAIALASALLMAAVEIDVHQEVTG